MSRAVDLVALSSSARSVGCELVTREFLADLKKTHARLRDAEGRLHDVTALRLVAEREDWRGWLVRRWIKKTERALASFRGDWPEVSQ